MDHETKNPFDEDVLVPSGGVIKATPDPVVSEPTEVNTEVKTEVDSPSQNKEEKTCEEIDDNCQPKPEYPQGVGMQTPGQPFTMPTGNPEQNNDSNAQGGAGSFNPQGNQNQQPNQPDPNAQGGAGSFNPQDNQNNQPDPNAQGGANFTPQQGGSNAPQNQGFNSNQGFDPNPNPNQGGGFNQNPNQGGGFNQNPNQGGGFNPNQGGGFNPNQGGGFNNNEKFVIVDMFWFVNRKLYTNTNFDQNECHVLTIGFNAAFNNMRISMFTAGEGAFTDTSIIIGNCNKLANFNIFSEHALQILHTQKTPIRIFERVIRAGSWSPNKSEITNNGDHFLVHSMHNQVNCNFKIADEQVIGFTKALEFLLNGQSWHMATLGVINR